MRITDYLQKDAIKVFLTGTDKISAIRELVDAICDSKLKAREDEIISAVLQREEISSTGVGNHVAIPHARLDGYPGIYVCCGLSEQEIEFQSLDGKPVRLFFLLLGDSNRPDLYMRFLARISRLLNDCKLREQLLSSTNACQLYDALTQYEDRHFS